MKMPPATKSWHDSWNRHVMISLFLASTVGLWLAISLPAHAADVFDGLPDPTRPSGWQDGGGSIAAQGLVLQSTSVSASRRIAVINGQRLAVGDRVQGATVVDVQPFQVRLQRAGADITLRLTPPLAKEKP